MAKPKTRIELDPIDAEDGSGRAPLSAEIVLSAAGGRRRRGRRGRQGRQGRGEGRQGQGRQGRQGGQGQEGREEHARQGPQGRERDADRGRGGRGRRGHDRRARVLLGRDRPRERVRRAVRARRVRARVGLGRRAARGRQRAARERARVRGVAAGRAARVRVARLAQLCETLVSTLKARAEAVHSEMHAWIGERTRARARAVETLDALARDAIEAELPIEADWQPSGIVLTADATHLVPPSAALAGRARARNQLLLHPESACPAALDGVAPRTRTRSRRAPTSSTSSNSGARRAASPRRARRDGRRREPRRRRRRRRARVPPRAAAGRAHARARGRAPRPPRHAPRERAERVAGLAAEELERRRGPRPAERGLVSCVPRSHSVTVACGAQWSWSCPGWGGRAGRTTGGVPLEVAWAARRSLLYGRAGRGVAGSACDPFLQSPRFLVRGRAESKYSGLTPARA